MAVCDNSTLRGLATVNDSGDLENHRLNHRLSTEPQAVNRLLTSFREPQAVNIIYL
jgi:hypothetical protein